MHIAIQMTLKPPSLSALQHFRRGLKGRILFFENFRPRQTKERTEQKTGSPLNEHMREINVPLTERGVIVVSF